MAVMRVEKSSNYTVMSNHHLRDQRLSLKAKGLLSVMLSLPVEWDFSSRADTPLAGRKEMRRNGISLWHNHGKVCRLSRGDEGC